MCLGMRCHCNDSCEKSNTQNNWILYSKLYSKLYYSIQCYFSGYSTIYPISTEKSDYVATLEIIKLDDIEVVKENGN